MSVLSTQNVKKHKSLNTYVKQFTNNRFARRKLNFRKKLMRVMSKFLQTKNLIEIFQKTAQRIHGRTEPAAMNFIEEALSDTSYLVGACVRLGDLPYAEAFKRMLHVALQAKSDIPKWSMTKHEIKRLVKESMDEGFYTMHSNLGFEGIVALEYYDLENLLPENELTDSFTNPIANTA